MPSKVIHRIARNDYAFTIFTKIFAMLIGLVASAFSSRYLGPALKGELAYINAVLTIVAVVGNFGLYQPYPYYKRQNEPDALDKFMNIFSLQFVVYTAVGIVLAVALRSPALAAVCLIAPVQVLANQLSFMIMVEDVKYKNVVFFTARIVNTSIIILAFFTMSPALWVALAMIVVGDVITVVMTVRRLKRFGNPFKADLGFLRKIFGFGFVAMLTTLLLTLNYRVDVLMLEWMGIASAQIGFYTTGMSLAEYAWLIPDAFREVLFSRTAKDDAIDDMTFSLKVNFYITLMMILAIAVFGQWGIRLMYGAAFLPSYRVTVMLLFGVLSMSYFKLIGTLLLAQGKKGLYLGLLSCSVLVNIVCNWLAIPRFGIEGAALASVLSYTVAGFVFLAYFMRTYHVSFGSLFIIRSAEIKAIWHKVRRR